MAITKHILGLLILLAVIVPSYATCSAVKKCLAGDTICTTLPVPPSSLPPLVAPNSFLLKELRQGVYSYYDGVYFSLILFNKQRRRLAIMDAPNPAGGVLPTGEYLLNEAIHKVLNGTMLRRTDIVYGHRHIDHIGGAGMVNANLTKTFPKMRVLVWGTSETHRFLGPRSRLPRVTTFVPRRGRTVNLSRDLELKLIMVRGHTHSDLIGHVLPSRTGAGVAHLTDFVTAGFTPFLDFALVNNLKDYLWSLRRLRSLDFKTFSAGHGRLGNKQDITNTIKYTLDVIRFRQEAAKEVTPMMLAEAGLGRVRDPKAVEFGNGGFAFNVQVNLQANICMRKTIQKYGCLLGSVADFAASHCKEAFFFDLIDQE